MHPLVLWNLYSLWRSTSFRSNGDVGTDLNLIIIFFIKELCQKESWLVSENGLLLPPPGFNSPESCLILVGWHSLARGPLNNGNHCRHCFGPVITCLLNDSHLLIGHGFCWHFKSLMEVSSRLFMKEILYFVTWI